jgi:HSP20 family molecular chaperone IbpA
MTALQKYINQPNQFPSLFGSSIYDEILKGFPETKWYPSQTSYPYDVDEIRDTDGNVKLTYLRFACAGTPKENISISVNNHNLYIKIDKHTHNYILDGGEELISRHKGISTRSGEFSFALYGVDEDNITSKFEDGILTIVLKPSTYKPKKEIAIN